MKEANNVLAKFIIEGEIGPLRIGSPISELIAFAGPPPTWEGKPGTFLGHRGIVNYHASSTWIYNGVHVYIEGGGIERLALWIDNLMDWSHEWFREWPFSLQPKLSEVKDYLDSELIPYAIDGGEMGSDIIMYKAYIFGVAMRNAKLSDLDVHGIMRVKDCNDLPLGVDASILNELRPRGLKT